MKTIKDRIDSKIKTMERVAVVLFLMLAVGCSKDDDGGSGVLITVQASTFEIGAINDCTTSLGDGTRLSFETPYTTDPGVKISKMQVKTTVSDGDTKDQVNTNFTDTGTHIKWALCFTYGPQAWVEYEVRLEASDGSVSNISKVRVAKPSGAN